MHLLVRSQQVRDCSGERERKHRNKVVAAGNCTAAPTSSSADASTKDMLVYFFKQFSHPPTENPSMVNVLSQLCFLHSDDLQANAQAPILRALSSCLMD